MPKPFQRVGALAIALLFLGTTIAFTAVILFEMRRENADVRPASSNSADSTTNDQGSEQMTQLQGTKLEGFAPVASVTELQKIDLQEGNGETVQPGATVTAHYTGALASDGTIFQSSHDIGQPIPFSLSGVIQGWTEGVPGMKVGGKRRLIIPAEMAYGAQEQPGIPANSALVFDIEVVSVK